MNDDVVKKLEYWAFKLCGKGEQEDAASDVMSEALKEIIKLRDETERLARERDEARSKETDYREGFQEGWDAAHEGTAAVVEKLRAALRWYADHRNHFPVLHHRRAGDPDPVSVFVEEPPIMTDGGRRAREALEAKP